MKKIGFVGLLLLELLSILGVYIVKGQLGAFIWNAHIFIFGPLASVALLIQLILLIVRLCKKKQVKWNLLYISLTIVLAYPVTILFGKSVLTYPTSESKQNVVYALNPVKDSILLGGKEYKTHAIWPSECYAYDILKEPYNIGSSNLSDYGIYLADVYCPVNGKVIACKDDEEDIEPNTEEFISSLGNYIFIEIDKSGTYMILAHLEKDSISVSVGDHVQKGEIIAKVGNSGTTSEPHLHMQHQKNNPMTMHIPVCAVGLPIEIE